MGKNIGIPWQESNGEIRTKQNVLLATMKAHLPINGIDQKANAAFIVKACNNHFALVEACKRALIDLKAVPEVENRRTISVIQQALAQVEKG